MKLELSLILVCFIFFTCDREIKQINSVEGSANIDSIMGTEILRDSIKYVICNDSLISLYNGLDKIRFHNSFFHLGELKYKDQLYYVRFQTAVDLQSPDSIENAIVDPEKYLVELGRGYYVANVSFFKDSFSVYAFIKMTDANVGYGEDNIMYVLKRDSTNKWIENTDYSIDRVAVLKSFFPKFSSTNELRQVFHINYNPDSNNIVLSINKGRLHYCEHSPKDIICQLKAFQLNDSLVLKWSPKEGKYKIREY